MLRNVLAHGIDALADEPRLFDCLDVEIMGNNIGPYQLY
jgi:hypothetical protein